MLAHIGTMFGASGCLVVLLLLTAVRLRRALALRRRPAVYRRRARKLQERAAALFLFPSASAITTTRHLRMLTCPCALTHASGHAQRTLRPTASARPVMATLGGVQEHSPAALIGFKNFAYGPQYQTPA